MGMLLGAQWRTRVAKASTAKYATPHWDLLCIKMIPIYLALTVHLENTTQSEPEQMIYGNILYIFHDNLFSTM